MIPKDDWRRMGQEKHLLNVHLKYVSQYVPHSPAWEHEHCAFCFAKFSENEKDLPSGYCTLDEKHWICAPCFHDFQEEFCWIVEGSKK